MQTTNFAYFEKPLLSLSEPLVTSVEGWKYVATKLTDSLISVAIQMYVCALVWYCLLNHGEFLLKITHRWNPIHSAEHSSSECPHMMDGETAVTWSAGDRGRSCELTSLILKSQLPILLISPERNNKKIIIRCVHRNSPWLHVAGDSISTDTHLPAIEQVNLLFSISLLVWDDDNFNVHLLIRKIF